MYKLIVDEGVVLDKYDNQIAPCQSADDPAFILYNQWVEAGNQPEVIDTRG